MKRIQIGIVDGHPGWDLLLSQEGVPFAHRDDNNFFEDCSLLVAGDLTQPTEINQIKNFLGKGKALLCSGTVGEAITGRKCHRRLLKSVVPGLGSHFDGVRLTDLYLNGRIFPGANELFDERRHPTAFHGELCGGYVVVMPFDPAAAVVDARTMTKSFYATRRRLPYERVPLVSKPEVRKIVARSLEFLHGKIGLPYIHRWYYPGRAPSVSAFRIDTDGAGAQELRGLADLSSRMRFPFSWFIDVQSQLRQIEFYSSMERQEIGLHCFRHRRYTSGRDALGDLGEGIKFLREQGFAVGGCALPYGQWSADIGKALEQLNVRYSSEFSYDVDNLPSFPDLGSYRSRVLQIPVHPISIGNLRRQGFPEEEMVRYYESLVHSKISRREPALLYHHPKNKGRAVLEAIFSTLRKEQVATMTMAEYASWWIDRTGDILTIDVESDRLRVAGLTGSSDAMFRIVSTEGKEAFAAPSASLDLKSLSWADPPVPVPLPDDIRRSRKYNPWVAIQHVEDVLTALVRRK